MLHKLSYWEKDHYFDRVDIVIVGSGIVGLNTGIKLLELDPSLKVLILEKSNIPYGASTRNAGFACFGSPSELLEDLKIFSNEEVFGLFAQRYEGIKALLNRIGNQNIELQQFGGKDLMSNGNLISNKQIDFLNTQIELYTGLKEYFSINNTYLNTSGLIGFDQVIVTGHESCINPMKMIDSLLQIYLNLGGRILYNSEVVHWNETDKNVEIKLHNEFSFNANKILFAINGFAQNLFPSLDLRAARNQVLIIKPEKELNLIGCHHYDQGYIYFRNVHGNLLIGGARNQDIETEYSDQMEINEKIKAYLLNFVQEHILPNQKIEIYNHWVGILGLGSEKIPIIKLISKRIGVAVRLSGVGIAIGTLIGNKAAEMMVKE